MSSSFPFIAGNKVLDDHEFIKCSGAKIPSNGVKTPKKSTKIIFLNGTEE